MSFIFTRTLRVAALCALFVSSGKAVAAAVSLAPTPADSVIYSYSTWAEILQAEEKSVGKQLPGEAPWVTIPPAEVHLPKDARVEKDFVSPPPVPRPPAPALTADFEAILNSGFPPDTNGAVGPSHLVITVNFSFRIQERDGTILNTASLLSFFHGFGLLEIFDPKIIYDPMAERFVIVACGDKRAASSSMVLAVSETSDPTGGWHRFRLLGDELANDWVDYPNIGITRDRITFTCNMFSIANDAFRGVNLWVVEKDTALDGGGLTSTRSRLMATGSTLVPALTFDEELEEQYLVNALLPAFGALGVYKITGPPGAPEFETLTLYPAGDPGATPASARHKRARRYALRATTTES